MPSVIVAGVILINIALVLYSTFFYKERKYKRATNSLLVFITVAVTFDISATVCMMLGAKEYFTAHGILGYTALSLMFIDAILIWKHKLKHGSEVQFGVNLNRYTLFAYILWLIAFATGVYLAKSS